MPRTRPLAASAALALVIALGLPGAALAAQRWTSPDATGTTGACTAAAPCRIDAAVNHALAGDEVIVQPGTYDVTITLDPVAPVDIHGVAGQPRPHLVGAQALSHAVLSDKQGGTVRHLAITATSKDGDAVTLQGVTAEDLILLSGGGDGGKVVASAAGTILRDSVVRTDASGDKAALKLREDGGGGDVHLVNVTAVAPAASGIRCELRNGQATLVNTLARGDAHDVDASIGAPGHCTARASDFRPDLSPAVVDGGGNVAGDPLFVDGANGDYRPVAGSPTVDAGVADPLLGATDLAGCPRTLGAAPDIGAYELAAGGGCTTGAAEPLGVEPPAPSGGDDQGNYDDRGDDQSTAPAPSGPPPVIGRRVVLAPARGHIRFRRPGATRFQALGPAARVPVGSVIDARKGRVRLTSAIDAHGTVQTGTFWGAQFVVRQGRHGKGMTTLGLRGGSFRRVCGASAAAASAASAPLASAARRRHRHRRVRSLWARDRHGRFRTHGANSVATARGTAWLTEDRCDGTRTRVTRGAVAVRDLVRHRTVLVRAGHAYLARKHR